MSIIRKTFNALRYNFRARLLVVSAIIVANIIAGFLPGLPIFSQVSGTLYLASAIALLALTIAQACNVLSKNGRSRSNPKVFALLNLILAAQFLSVTLLVGEFLTSFYIISSPAALIPMPTIFVSIIGGLTTVMMIGLLWTTRNYGSRQLPTATPVKEPTPPFSSTQMPTAGEFASQPRDSTTNVASSTPNHF